MTAGEADLGLLERAVELGSRAPAAEGSYSVGCVIASAAGEILGTGFTRELGEGWHAEAVALEKARSRGRRLEGASVYSSLEPCSRRLSGRTSCCERLIEAGVARVVYCLDEPPVFVHCEGAETLRAAGLQVIRDDRFAERVRQTNRHILER